MSFARPPCFTFPVWPWLFLARFLCSSFSRDTRLGPSPFGSSARQLLVPWVLVSLYPLCINNPKLPLPALTSGLYFNLSWQVNPSVPAVGPVWFLLALFFARSFSAPRHFAGFLCYRIFDIGIYALTKQFIRFQSQAYGYSDVFARWIARVLCACRV